MKKVLSVLLAASMVMGMSVSVFADKKWGEGAKDAVGDVPVEELLFDDTMFVKFADGHVEPVHESTPKDEFIFHPGDVAWFPIMVNDTVEVPDKEKEPICGKTAGHVHTVEDCYELTCEKHVHTEECIEIYACENPYGGHEHSEDCYEYDVKDDIADCGKHVHAEHECEKNA